MVKLSTIHELALQAAPSTRARGIAVKLSPAAYLHCIALPPPDRNSPRAKLQKWPHAITVSPQICRRKLSTKKKENRRRMSASATVQPTKGKANNLVHC